MKDDERLKDFIEALADLLAINLMEKKNLRF
jgi:hypothetical protein